MLVLQPSTFIEMAGPLGDAVSVTDGVAVAVSVESGALVLVDVTVTVATTGVEVLTPITTGVGVYMDEVGVAGRKGVGPGKG
jgi:hypothetical protein